MTSSLMKVAYYSAYGPPSVVSIKEVPKPTKPAKGKLLVKVKATSVQTGDVRMRAAQFPPGFGILGRLGLGITGPRNHILGTEFSGDVEEVGEGVTDWKAGDAILGQYMGSHAQYIVVASKSSIARKPASVSYEDAACAVFGGSTAAKYLKLAKAKPNEKVLVLGASGAVGSAAVQLAKRVHQCEVTGVCSSSNVDHVRELGADKVVDYAQEDPLKAFGTYDIILDPVGKPVADLKKCLREGGRIGIILGTLMDTIRNSPRVIAVPVFPNADEVAEMAQMVAEGKFKPVIAAVFPLDRIVEAHEMASSGHKRGNVVVTMP